LGHFCCNAPPPPQKKDGGGELQRVHENLLCIQVILFSFRSVWNKGVESFQTDGEWHMFLSSLAVTVIIAAMSILMQKEYVSYLCITHTWMG
jgi:hypothetical protein